jgi:hypothetical protein
MSCLGSFGSSCFRICRLKAIWIPSSVTVLSNTALRGQREK